MCRVPRRRWLVLCWLILWLCHRLPVDASDIGLTNGQNYRGATILHRDETSIEIQLEHGRMTLPLSVVATIDGRKVIYAPPVVPAAPTPRPSVVRHAPVPVARPTTATPPPATSAARSAPAAISRAEAASNLSHGSWSWLALALVVGGGIWVWTVLLVRKDLRSRQTTSNRWWIVSAVFPLIGYLLYKASRQTAAKLETWQKARNRIDFELLDAEHNLVTINIGEEITGIENAKEILQAALHQRASDVHIEPLAQECRVRYRIDGTLYTRARLNPDAGLRLISALKSLAQVDITERRRAQDGRFGGRSGGRTVDFRVATTPSVNGEKLVIRILDRNVGLRSLNDLGMPEHMLKDFTRASHSRAGMILATGPTGSGKTSTLYASLSQLDAVQLNLVTIEDPVEYELAGATQIPVNTKAGVTFETGLRSILRQDPDVIFVGEMRDLEAAQIALRSALTGHLVFSSLHTRDAVGTISRLLDMGLDRPLLSSAVSVVLAQRLVRVLCRACRRPTVCQGNELEALGFELPPEATIYEPVGCRKCEGTGYVGRTGVFEMLVMDDELRAALNGGMAEDPFTKLARDKGFRSYREEAAQKVLLGMTSVEEVLKVT